MNTATAAAPTTYSSPPPAWLADWQALGMQGHPEPLSFGPDSRPTPGVYAPDSQGVGPSFVEGPQAAPDPRRFDQGRYWVGAALTAAIAALTGVIGLVVATGIFGIHIVLPGTGTALSIGAYGLVVGGAALVAALLFDGMAHIAPHPTLYFRWLIGLITALAAVVPFTAATGLISPAIFAGVNILVGALILGLVPLAAIKSRP